MMARPGPNPFPLNTGHVLVLTLFQVEAQFIDHPVRDRSVFGVIRNVSIVKVWDVDRDL